MPEVTESTVIDRPRQEVWEFLQDPDNVKLTSANMQQYEQITEGEIDKGTRFHGVVKVAGREIEWTSEVTRYDEPNAFHTRSTDSPIEFTYDLELEDADGGTRVTVHQDIGSFGGFFGKLADPLVVRMYRKDLRTNLENMKEVVEAS